MPQSPSDPRDSKGYNPVRGRWLSCRASTWLTKVQLGLPRPTPVTRRGIDTCGSRGSAGGMVTAYESIIVMAVWVVAERPCSWAVVEGVVGHCRRLVRVERTAAPRPCQKENSSEFPQSSGGVRSLCHTACHPVQRAAFGLQSSCRVAPDRVVRPRRLSISGSEANLGKRQGRN